MSESVWRYECVVMKWNQCFRFTDHEKCKITTLKYEDWNRAGSTSKLSTSAYCWKTKQKRQIICLCYNLYLLTSLNQGRNICSPFSSPHPSCPSPLKVHFFILYTFHTHTRKLTFNINKLNLFQHSAHWYDLIAYSVPAITNQAILNWIPVSQ